MAVQIELKDIRKTYGDQTVLEHLNLEIQEGEFITLLGPSGCGKTTTLRIIGGFETPDRGQVLFNGQDITLLPPHLRPVNTLFQQYSLFPHLNVYENVAFGLRIRGTREEDVRRQVQDMLKLVDLGGYEKRKVDSLSGGQKQRVAMARALILKPAVFLLDEPLGALDLKLRKEMQIELKRIQKEVGITFIFVTHDQEEALTLSDRIVVMNEGIIQQVGTPIDIYNEPINAYVADFIGESNILEGIMHADCDVTFSGHRFRCVDEGFDKNEPVDVVIRPEDVELVDPAEGMLRGTVLSSLFMGVHNEMRIQTNREIYLAHSTLHRNVGEEVGIRIIPFNIHIMRKGEVEGDESL
ncbi:ABC transporter ATP-binding protein [Proteiniclasticum sp. QWL-01]|uniref:ABC transporter ATP-binding protein n=1 Tax=Proteiniclasticum sp. QWL-01 TaxID=3036945 RepID=UPI00220014FC|nr:ABC transporter ATP-binding protein [Proteiniclasticum sp. QWL-01]UUM10825.1 ABC transporter ATP-binding protein [Clostridiaceae bacterium HFYG-1003]WFF72171.1 ABC transporter ATP-binding protein [Proteiniclasticum sp. QWL-01]